MGMANRFHYRVTFRRQGAIQFSVETFHSAGDMAERITSSRQRPR